VEQVMRNLFLNAMQAMPSGGEIQALIRSEDGNILIEIRDRGAGFSKEAIRRWNEPFFSEREGGMGLGLTLVSDVMHAHRGSISVENRPGGGAAVRCSFPASTAESENS
jgi:signal transduction histidine kinase